MSNFRDLRVWQEACDLSVRIYKMNRNFPLIQRDFGLTDQMRRAAVSVPSNIAEGSVMPSDKHGIHFFYLAKASLAELTTQIIIAQETGLLPLDAANDLIASCKKIEVMLSKLIASRRNNGE